MKSMRGLGLLLVMASLAAGACAKSKVDGGGSGGSGGSGGIAGSGGSGGSVCGTCTDVQTCDTGSRTCVCTCSLTETQGGKPCRPGTFCQDDCSCAYKKGQIGDACTDAGQCSASGQGAICIDRSRDVDFPDGYCSRPCGSATPCSTGSVCTSFGCIADCTDESDCRDGYSCTTVSASADQCGNAGTGQKACFPKRSISDCTGAGCGKVGDACTKDNDCLPGGLCLTGGGWEGGYCSKLVTKTILDRFSCTTTDCGGKGTGCALTSQATDSHNPCLIGEDTFLCLDACDATKAGDCRDGYRCAPNLTLSATTCDTDADCADRPGMSCTVVTNVGRMCTLHCDSDKKDSCPDGYFCGLLGLDPGAICMAMCKTSADCNEKSGEVCSNYGLGAFDHQPAFQCTKDAECTVPGAICSRSTLPGSCSLSQPCPAGFSCTNGVCQTQNGVCLPNCASDADCKLTDIPGDTRTSSCVNGSCLFEVCRGPAKSGACVPYDCSDDSNCRSGCTSDALCSSGKCDLETGKCQTRACEGTGPTDSISAERKACGVTSNCGVGQVPDSDGLCQTPCTKAEDCGQGFTCTSSFCKSVPGVCNGGLGECSPPCSSDKECSHGFHCDNSTHCSLNCTSNDACPFGACNEETGRCSQPCPVDGCGIAGVCTDGVCYQSCIGDGARACPDDRYCDTTGGSCLLRCDAASAPACPGTEVCDPGSGQCVDRCPGRPCTTGVCNDTTGLCVECLVPADCTDGTTTCDAASKCAKKCTPPDTANCVSSQTCCDSGADQGTCQDSCP